MLLFQKIRKERQESLQRELLSLQLEHTREHIAKVESLYQDIRSLKHDMANHVVTLERLCGQGESGEAGRYAKHLKEQYIETAGTVRTGHPVTDVILQEKRCEIVNGFTGGFDRDAASGLPFTTKKVQGKHEYGLRNMQKVA